MITFDELTEIEPRLKAIEESVTKDKNLSTMKKNKRWYEIHKPVMNKLVGWNTENPELKNSWCYSVAYQHLINILGI